MRIFCSHWSGCGVNGGGCCALDKYGGKPSLGVCRHVCPHGPQLKPPAPSPAGEAKREPSAGDSVGANKNERRTPPTPLQLADAERNAAICATCEHVKRDKQGQPRITLTKNGFPVYRVGCEDCGCAGLSLIEGDCPLNKWPLSQAKIFEEAMQRRRERDALRAKEAAEKAAKRAGVEAPRPAGRAIKPARDQLVLRDGWGEPVHLRELYRGAHAFLLCGGPSLATMDLEPLKQPGVLTMAVNNAVKLFRPNLWTCVDSGNRFLRSIWYDPTITKFVPEKRKTDRVFDSDAWAYTDKKVHQCPNVLYYPRNARFNHETFLDEPTVNWGHDADKDGKVVPKDSLGRKGTRSVMLAALRLLHHLGVRQVYLVGADFRMEAGRSYAFDQAKSKGAAKSNNRAYKHLDQRFAALRPLFERRGFHVFNCTPNSGLTAFPTIDFEEAVRQAAGRFGNIDLANERTAGLYTDKKT